MSALRQELAAFGLLALGFVLFSIVVASGAMTQTDHALARSLAGIWVQALAPLFLAIALLGGIEATVLVAAALAVFLWRRHYRNESLAVLALPVAMLLEEEIGRASCRERV